jgi:transcriptional regulator with XRE-family HTH domain
MQTSTAFGDLLRRHRIAAGLSQGVLAERAGLSIGAVQALEQGVRRAPYRQTVRALADALGVSNGEAQALEDLARRARSRRRGGWQSTQASSAATLALSDIDKLIALACRREVTLALLVIDNETVGHPVNASAEPVIHVLAANQVDLPVLGAIPDFSIRAATRRT